MRTVYSALLYLLAPLLVLRLIWQAARGQESWGRLPERFGWVPRAREIAVWVHAASVGETLAALPLIHRLVAAHPPRSVLVTTATATGAERARAALGDSVRHAYAPYDLPHVVRRFVSRTQPRRMIVMETELWPNLFRALAGRGIPLVIASARLSPRSVAGYSRVPRFAAATLADCTLIAAQSEDDAQRFRALGAPAARVKLMGNLKFDLELPAQLVARGQALRQRIGAARPVWVAASTHEGEEAAALSAHRSLRARLPDALLILAPRHPQRFPAVTKLIEQSGLAFTRRSQFDSSFPASDLRMTASILLADSMGELPLFLAAADLAFVGGSLVPIGGHNALEPAALERPVLFGPHMFNFEPARTLLLSCGAARQIDDASELAPAVSALLTDPAARAQMGQAGGAALAANRGALNRLMKLLEAV